jgi:hypothetical protein
MLELVSRAGPTPAERRRAARDRRVRRRRVGAALTLAVVAAVVWLIARAGPASHQAPTVTHARSSTARAPHRPAPGTASAPSTAGVPVGRWTNQPPPRLSRGEVSAALVGGAVYVVGGFGTDARSTAAVERLDPESGRWSISRPLPQPLNHMSAVGYGGDLYVVGGYAQAGDTSAGAVRSFWRFDPASGRWTRMPDAPLARAAAGAAVLGHRLYVAGGRSDTLTTIATLAIFDFDTGRWSLGPPLHHSREHVAAVAAAGAVWLLGGRALGQGNFADVERYRPGDAAWQRMAPMPIARSGFQAVFANGRIVTVGGEGPAGTIGEVDALNPATGRWSRLRDLPTPRHGLGLVALGPLVYAIEGGPQPGLTTSRVVQRLRVP